MNKTEQLKKMLREGLVTAAAVKAAKIPTSLITRMVKEGTARRAARGLYMSADSGDTETADYRALAANVPNGVFTLFSALRLHDLTDENPRKIYMMLRHGTHAPRISNPPVLFFYRKEPQFSEGVEIRKSCGIPIRVYTLEQTIADCFQYRNKIGIDVAVNALREAAQHDRIDWTRLWEAAKRVRMTHVMEPYVDALI